ncbi:MAG TPA: hypothetical protein VL068_13155, partial [Microthrixaceae bacterium]|nr:hypothetical protein [Microthrixaceae bacterium]
GTSTIQGAGVVGRSQTGPSLKLDESALSLPLSGSWSAGSFVVVDGHVFYCWKAGTGNAASWVKLSGAPIILPTGYRAYDSRAGKAPTTVQKGKTQSGKIRSNIDLTVGSGGALPLGISAVIINLTATGTDVSGYLTAYKNGSATPKTSSVNWSSTNSNIANTTIVPVDSASRIAITGAGSADFLIDVIGFLP